MDGLEKELLDESLKGFECKECGSIDDTVRYDGYFNRYLCDDCAESYIEDEQSI